MKLGGYAHGNGVTFFTEAFKLKATKKGEKETHDIQWIIPPKWLRRLEKKPVVGGLLLVYYQWKVFDKWVKALFLFLIFLYGIEGFLPNLDRGMNGGNLPWFVWAIGGILALLLLWRRLPLLLRYHGAEHKVINCFWKHGTVDFHLAKAAPRYNTYCGTNLVGVFFLLYGFIWFLKIESLLFTGIFFLLAVQVTKRLIQRKNPWADQYFKKLQWFTVWEPSDEQLKFAIGGFNRLLAAHTAYQQELLKKKAAE